MKILWMLGLMSLVWFVAYDRLAGGASEAAQGPGRPVTMPEPASLPDYVFLHQSRYESIPVHAMAGVKTCPE